MDVKILTIARVSPGRVREGVRSAARPAGAGEGAVWLLPGHPGPRENQMCCQDRKALPRCSDELREAAGGRDICPSIHLSAADTRAVPGGSLCPVSFGVAFLRHSCAYSAAQSMSQGSHLEAGRPGLRVPCVVPGAQEESTVADGPLQRAAAVSRARPGGQSGSRRRKAPPALTGRWPCSDHERRIIQPEKPWRIDGDKTAALKLSKIRPVPDFAATCFPENTRAASRSFGGNICRPENCSSEFTVKTTACEG